MIADGGAPDASLASDDLPRRDPAERAKLVVYLQQRLRAYAGAVTDDELRRQVEDGISAADVLAIWAPRHVYRFLRLRYAPASCWVRPGAENVFVRVLTDTSVDPDRRLAFVERLLRGPVGTFGE